MKGMYTRYKKYRLIKNGIKSETKYHFLGYFNITNVYEKVVSRNPSICVSSKFFRTLLHTGEQ